MPAIMGRRCLEGSHAHARLHMLQRSSGTAARPHLLQRLLLRLSARRCRRHLLLQHVQLTLLRRRPRLQRRAALLQGCAVRLRRAHAGLQRRAAVLQ